VNAPSLMRVVMLSLLDAVDDSVMPAKPLLMSERVRGSDVYDETFVGEELDDAEGDEEESARRMEELRPMVWGSGLATGVSGEPF